ncbi:hypothetical protein ACLOJK_003660 [Asimina triloba]
MDPCAIVAAYKVCKVGGCFSSDILEIMEAAIIDDVDVLSISLDCSNADYYCDNVVIGVFVMMQREIFVLCFAENVGTLAYMHLNVAPWITTGPNAIAPKSLKLDLIMPGVNILAAGLGALGRTWLLVDDRLVVFNIISDMSMSCPHVSGLAALIKGARPRWSLTTARLALMTTAYVAYGDGEALQDVAMGWASMTFDHGAGHVHSVKVLELGLVYNIAVADYSGFLCALGYVSECDEGSYVVEDLNHAPFDVVFKGSEGVATETVRHEWSLTNVRATTMYRVRVMMGSEAMKVVVEPEELRFGAENEKKVFVVSFSSTVGAMSKQVFRRLEWSDGKHVVGSLIAVSWM